MGLIATHDVAGVRRMLRNGGALLGSYLVPRFLTFAASLVAARVLGPGAFGLYGAASSFAMILSVAVTLGMLPLLVRELSRQPQRVSSLLAAAHIVKLGAAVLMLATLIAAGWLLDYSPELILAALLIGVGWIFNAFSENLGGWFQSQEQMHIWLEANVAFGIASGVLGIVLVLVTRNVVWFAAGFAFGQLAMLARLYTRMPASARTWAAVSRRDVNDLLRAVFPFAAGFLVLTLFYKTDLLLLERLQSVIVAGWYAAGYKLIDVVHALAVVASAAVYPRLARASSGDARAQAGSRTVELFLLGGTLAASMLWLLREPIILLLFGEAYRETTVVLGLLAPALSALVVNILGGYLLSVANRIGFLSLCYAAAYIVKLLLAIWWIPQFGAEGMAAAMLVAEFTLSAFLLVALARAGAGAPRWQPIALSAGAAALVLPCAVVAQTSPILAGILYLTAVSLIYRWFALSAEERRVLVAAVSPR